MALGERALRHDALGGDEAPLGGAQEEGVEEGVGAEDLRVASAVGAIGVDDRRVEAEGRHGDQLDVGIVGVGEVGTSGAVGGPDEPQVGIDDEDVGAQPRPCRQERDAPRRGLQAEEEHPLVQLHHLDAAVLPRGPPMGIEGDGVERHEAADDLAHLPGGAEQADVGAAVGDDGEVRQVGAADGADRRHGLAPRAPTADADGHARTELGDDAVDAAALVAHRATLISTCRRRASPRRRRVARRPRRARAART